MQFRRQKLIDRSLQLRLVGSFLLVGGIAALFLVVQLNHSVLTLSEELGPDGADLLRQAPRRLALTLLATLAVLVPVTSAVGILATHRIAGPAYHMRKYLEHIAKNGAPSYPCKIRRKDELHDMCALVNSAVSAVVEGPREAPAAQHHIDETRSLLPQEDSIEYEVENNS